MWKYYLSLAPSWRKRNLKHFCGNSNPSFTDRYKWFLMMREEFIPNTPINYLTVHPQSSISSEGYMFNTYNPRLFSLEDFYSNCLWFEVKKYTSTNWLIFLTELIRNGIINQISLPSIFKREAIIKSPKLQLRLKEF